MRNVLIGNQMSRQLVTFPLFAHVTVQLDFFLLLDWNDSTVYWEHIGLVILDLALFINFFLIFCFCNQCMYLC